MSEDSSPQMPKKVKAAKHNAKKLTTTQRGYGTQHQKLRKQVLAEQPLCVCMRAWSYHLHHIDHNPRNTARENVIGLCLECHKKVHKTSTN